MRKVVRKPTNFGVQMASLFAGVGGFEYGAKAAGMKVVAWSEFDPTSKAKVQPNQKVMLERFPEAQAFGDVADVSYADLGRPRVLTAGSPCQGFSVAGLRKGMLDSRSGLFAEFVRIVREGLDDGGLEYAVWENVTGALSSAKGGDFANVLAAMVGADEPLYLPRHGRVARWAGVAFGPLGWFAWRTLDAQHFGLGQRRQRIYGVWSPGTGCITALFGPDAEEMILTGGWIPDVEQGDITAVWCLDTENIPFNTGMEPDDPQRVKLSAILEPVVDEKYYLTEKACIGILTRATRRNRTLPPVLHFALWAQAGCPEEFTPTAPLTEEDFAEEALPFASAFIASPEDRSRLVPGDPCPTITDPARHGVSVLVPVRKVKRAQNNTDHETWTLAEFSNTLNCYDIGDVRATDIVVQHSTFVLYPDDRRGGKGAIASRPVGVSSALTATELAASTDRGVRIVEAIGSQSPEVTYRVRRLTPTECERLQGFPDEHTFVGNAADSHRYKQMGNAVAVPCAAWVLARVRAVIDGRELPGLTEVLEELPWVPSASSVGSPTKRVVRRKSRPSSVPENSASSSAPSPSPRATSSPKKRVVRCVSSSVSTPR